MDIKKTAYFLGLAGLLPFLAGAIAAWTFDIHHQTIAFKGTILYAAMILSFLGALYWGQALSQNSDNPPKSRWLVWSVLPFLCALPLLALPYIVALSGLIMLFVVCLGVDHLACRKNIMPLWMLKLRFILTTGVVLILVSVWFSAFYARGAHFSMPLIPV